MSIPLRVLSFIGLVGVGVLSFALLVWGTMEDSQSFRAWGLWFGAVCATWAVLYGSGFREAELRRRLAHEERLAEVRRLDPDRL